LAISAPTIASASAIIAARLLSASRTRRSASALAISFQ
jgi:hypothetical protein